MKCPNCNQDIDENADKCTYCGYDTAAKVRVMSDHESRSYRGVTIDENHDKEAAGQYSDRPRIFVRQFSLWGGGGWLRKAAVMLIIAAIVGLLLFVFLPVALLAVGVGILIWFIINMFRQ